MSSVRPTIPELRAVAQPPDHLGRVSAEHWTGTLYLRRLSLYVTWLILPTGITANGVTWVFIFAGVFGAAGLLIPGIIGALMAAFMMQVQGMLDCTDGEVARWRRTFSPAGIYLDRVGHYLTESALAIFLGVRAGGGIGELNGWLSAGLFLALIHMFTRVESDLVDVSRLQSGLTKAADSVEVARPAGGVLSKVRSAARFLPFYRIFVAIEFSLLALAAAIIDAIRGDLAATQVLLMVMIPLALITAAGHLLAILTSRRLKAG